MYGYGTGSYHAEHNNEEELREEELAEAEQMIRNGAGTRHLMRRRFVTLGQSDLFRLYRKFGREPGGTSEEDPW